MKKFVLLLVLAFALFSCKKEDPALFRLAIGNISFPVQPALDPLATHFFTIKDVPTNSLAAFAAKGVDTADIKNIIPRRATLRAVFGEEKMDFLREHEVSIRLCPRGEGDVSQYCGTEVFYQDFVPFDTGYELDLYGSNVDDVRDVILSDRVDVRIIFKRLSFPPPGTFNVEIYMEFEVR